MNTKLLMAGYHYFVKNGQRWYFKRNYKWDK